MTKSKQSEAGNALSIFARGRGGLRPADHVLGAASRVMQRAIDRSAYVGAGVDDDGTLALDLRLRNGCSARAKVHMNGYLEAVPFNGEEALLQWLKDPTEGQLWEFIE